MRRISPLPLFYILPIIFNACDTGKSSENINETAVLDSVELTTKDSTAFEKNIGIQSDQTDLNVVNTDSIEIAETEVDSVDVDSVGNVLDGSFAKVPKQLEAMGISQMSIPKVSEIGIGTYPGSYVVKVGQPFKYKEKSYNTMELVSAETPEKVLEFYKNQKENWLYVEQNGVHTFKKDKDAYFRATNNLQIQPFNLTKHPGVDSLFDFEPKSFILIYYELPSKPM